MSKHRRPSKLQQIAQLVKADVGLEVAYLPVEAVLAQLDSVLDDIGVGTIDEQRRLTVTRLEQLGPDLLVEATTEEVH